MTREEILEHALRALIHAADDDSIEAARYLCIDSPGHSVLSEIAAKEIDLWRRADAPDLNFAEMLPRPGREDER